MKRYVSNRARPEGSIAKAYILKKCITFSSLYVDGVENVHNRRKRNANCGEYGQGLMIFSQTARPTKSRQNNVGVSSELRDIGQWYLLYNCPELEPYLKYVKSYFDYA